MLPTGVRSGSTAGATGDTVPVMPPAGRPPSRRQFLGSRRASGEATAHVKANAASPSALFGQRFDSNAASEEKSDAPEETSGHASPRVPADRPMLYRPHFGPGRAAARQAWSSSNSQGAECLVPGEKGTGHGSTVPSCTSPTAGTSSDASILEREDALSESSVDENDVAANEYDAAVFSNKAAAEVPWPQEHAPAAAVELPLHPRRLPMPPPKTRVGWAEPKSRFLNGRLARASKLMHVQLRALDQSD